MPKIPDYNDLGSGVIPIARQQITSPHGGAIRANAISEAGEVLSRRAKINQEKQDGFRYKKAKAELLLSASAAAREIEDVEDYETWVEQFGERMSKAKEKASALIRNDDDRAVFDLDATLEIEKGSEHIRGLALRREVDDGRSALQDFMERNRTAILETDDTELRQSLINANKDLILEAEKKGYITSQEAEKFDSAWTRDTAEGMLVMLEPEVRAKMLANPQGTLAEGIPPDRRAVMLRQAQEENKVTRNRAASFVETDRIMAAHSDDRAAALAEARKISDPDVRALTESEINQRHNEIKVAKAEDDMRRFDEAANLVEGGSKIADIPADDWVKLSVNERHALEQRYRQVQTGEEPIHNDEKYYEWTSLPIADQAAQNLLEWRPYFDDRHYDQAVARQQAIRDAKEGGTAGKEYLTQASTLDQRISEALLSGSNPIFPSKPSAKNSSGVKRWNTINDRINRAIESDSASKGRKLTPLEMQEHVDAVVMDSYFVDEWGRDPQKLGVELSDEDKQAAYVPYEEIPENQRKRLENYASSLDLSPSKDAVSKAYAAARLQLGNERIHEILAGD